MTWAFEMRLRDAIHFTRSLSPQVISYLFDLELLPLMIFSIRWKQSTIFPMMVMNKERYTDLEDTFKNSVQFTQQMLNAIQMSKNLPL